MTTPLSEVPAGRFVRIRELQSAPDVCHRLRELGFCENALVRCMTNAEGTLICEVCNARVGINHDVAKNIVVSAFA